MSQKTLAIRLDDELHARITILARLGGLSVTDAIRDAVRAHIDALAADPAIAAKAAALREQIARDADEQQAAIQALFGTPTAQPRTARASSSK